jgi:hypothetical protein
MRGDQPSITLLGDAAYTVGTLGREKVGEQRCGDGARGGARCLRFGFSENLSLSGDCLKIRIDRKLDPTSRLSEAERSNLRRCAPYMVHIPGELVAVLLLRKRRRSACVT